MNVKKVLSIAASSLLIAAMSAGCSSSNGSSSESTNNNSNESSSAAPASTDKLIKVGIINNDPNESGYRTANDKDLKAAFTKENG